MSERPKKCSRQALLKVMEEHFLQGAKFLSKKTQCLPPSGLLPPFSGATPGSSLLATLIIKNALIQLSNEVSGCSMQSRVAPRSTLVVRAAQGGPAGQSTQS